MSQLKKGWFDRTKQGGGFRFPPPCCPLPASLRLQMIPRSLPSLPPNPSFLHIIPWEKSMGMWEILKHPYSQYLLRICYVSATTLGARTRAENKAVDFALTEFPVFGEAVTKILRAHCGQQW